MQRPVLLTKERKLGYKFMAAEAWWILTGQNSVETIKPYSKAIGRFSDDGIYYHGAYGPKIIDQLTYVVDSLSKDLHSRQAVINIWREKPAASKDVPCTLSLQFIIRDNRLHCCATMRSSDAWLGWPYDVFSFSMVAAKVRELLILRNLAWDSIQLGYLTITAGSQHIYECNYLDVDKIFIFDDLKYTALEQVAESTPDIVKYLSMIKDYTPKYGNYGTGFSVGFLDNLFEEVYGGE